MSFGVFTFEKLTRIMFICAWTITTNLTESCSTWRDRIQAWKQFFS